MRKALKVAAGTTAATAAAAVAGLAIFSALTARRVTVAVPARGKFVDVGGDRIHYREAGSGPPLLLIHGLAAQMGSFADALVDDLAADHRVILVDRPGAGHSARGRGASASLHAQADAIAGLIRALDLGRPVLVGHSLGGALSLAVALDHPDLVGGLALIAPLTQVVRDPPPVFRGLAIRSSLARHAVAWTLATPFGLLRGADTLREVFRPDPVPADYPLAGGGALGLRPSAFYAASSDLVALEDVMPGLADRYPTLSIPVSILYGRGDALLDPELHGVSTAREIPFASIDLVDGGHMLPFTAPAATAAWIRIAALKKA